MKRSLAIFMLLFGLAAAPFAHAQTDPEINREAAALGAEGPALRSFLARSNAQGLPKGFVLEVLGEARRLEAQGIPAEPYLLKANEGLAKGVAPDKIRPALGQTQRRSETAARLVDQAVASGVGGDSPQARRKAILQFQSALLNGVPASELEKSIDRLEGRGGPRPSLEQLGSETRSLQPRRHTVVSVPKPTQPRRTPSEGDSAAQPSLKPRFETDEKGAMSNEKGRKAKEDKGYRDSPGRDEKDKAGKGPWKSKGNSGSSGQGKGKKK